MKISKEVKFGIMAILAILAFVFGMSFMKGSRIFGSTMILYGEYDNVNGLIRGNPVTINGLNIGKVTELKLKSGEGTQIGKVLVTMELNQEHPIPDDSRAEIYSADLLGSMAVDISIGKSSQLLTDESSIQGGIKTGFMDEAAGMMNNELDPLFKKLNTLATELAGVAKSLNSSLAPNEKGDGGMESIMKNLDGTTDNLKALSYKLSSLSATVDSLATSAGGVMNNLENSNEKITGIISNVGVLTDSLAYAGSDIKQMASSANAAMANLDNMMGKLDKGEGSLGLLMNDKALYTDLDATITSMQTLLSSIQENPRDYLDVNVFVFGGKKKLKKQEKRLKELEAQPKE